MLKPVTNVLPAQPAGPKPVWRDLFQEPTYSDGQDFAHDEDEAPEGRDAIITA